MYVHMNETLIFSEILCMPLVQSNGQAVWAAQKLLLINDDALC